MNMDLYVYRARLAEPPHGGSPVYDGDTWWLWVDLGFDQWFRSRFRAASFDTPEISSRYASDFEKEQGVLARDEVAEWLDGRFYIRTFKASESHDVDDAGKYGRWLADPFRVNEDGSRNLMGDHLMAMDLATEWPTRWREVHDNAPSSLQVQSGKLS